MNDKKLLHITVGEMQTEDFGGLLYKAVVAQLREFGITSFMFRSQHGIDENNDIRFHLMDTNALNNLPITIEAIGNHDVSSSITEPLYSSHGQVFEIIVTEEHSQHDTEDPRYVLLKVYIESRFRWFKTELFQEIIQLCKQHKLIWSTAHIGLKDSFFQVHTPIMIEAIGTEDQIAQLIPSIQTIAPKCKMFTIYVNMILNK